MAQLIAKYEPKPREWYENLPVVYGFNIPKVRARLEWLMGTHIVQALDRGYQNMLLKVIEEDFATKVKKRNKIRQWEEINREKQLVLEGKMALDEAPKGISKNPVIKINAYIEAIQKEREEKMRKLRPTAVYDYDYSIIRKLQQMRGIQTAGYGEISYDVTSAYMIPNIRDDADDPEANYLLTPEEYSRSRPNESDIAVLDQAKDVAELYKIADFVLGYDTADNDLDGEITVGAIDKVEEVTD